MGVGPRVCLSHIPKITMLTLLRPIDNLNSHLILTGSLIVMPNLRLRALWLLIALIWPMKIVQLFIAWSRNTLKHGNVFIRESHTNSTSKATMKHTGLCIPSLSQRSQMRIPNYRSVFLLCIMEQKPLFMLIYSWSLREKPCTTLLHSHLRRL